MPSEAVEVAVNPKLLQLLIEGGVDRLFQGSRLSYPGRADLEAEMGAPDPYTMAHEARTIRGIPIALVAGARHLARQELLLARQGDEDPRLLMLWSVHDEFSYGWAQKGELSLDRLVAALVAVERMRGSHGVSAVGLEAAEALLLGLHSLGLPPTHQGLEELFDGAFPACVGLGIVEI